MDSELCRPRLDGILAFPHPLLAYERWLEERRRAPPTERDYLFSEERVRFEPRKDDIVVPLPGVRLEERTGTMRLQSREPAFDIELTGISRTVAERLLSAMDGKRCLLETRLDARVDALTLARFLRATFGRAVFAPEAVERLESAVPSIEITRFPGPGYAIDRAYWDNMGDVRRIFEQQADAALADVDAFVHLLRTLHVVSLMGESLESFYKPASPVSDHIVAPGAFFTAPVRLRPSPRGTLYLDGPRVNVSLVGGAAYHRTLYESLGDPDAMLGERTFSYDDLPWGAVVTARSEREEDPRPWFCPPRPITPDHFAVLLSYLRRAVAQASAGEGMRALPALARFHQGFVRLHPFHCANQSLAMNLVNAVLAKAHGAGMAHFIMDHFALRLSTEAYEEVFRRAVNVFAVRESDPVRRYAMARDRKVRSLSFIQKAAAAQGLASLCDTDPDGARFALLRP